MSLYTEAAAILSSTDSETGSLKSVIYNGDIRKRDTATNSRKSAPAALYALITEAAKWDVVLKEVVDNAGLLKLEHKLTPLLALLLVHDLLLAKRGIAAPAKHSLRIAVERNRARLQAEFTKARLKRKCANVEELGKALLKEKGRAENGGKANLHPRWVRVNTIRASLKDVLDSTFPEYRHTETFDNLGNGNVLVMDRHVPELMALPRTIDLTKTPAYRDGQIILQDKASCFPAYLLLQSEDAFPIGDVMDGCAAPGNKTTHLAAIIQKSQSSHNHRVFACERDPARSKTLHKMVNLAGAGQIVKVHAKQDFLALNPLDPVFCNITHLLLDPSCSGSGILGREDIPQLALPSDPKVVTTVIKKSSKKRKRGLETTEPTNSPAAAKASDMTDDAEAPDEADRLSRLSSLQLRIIEHAFSFPSARWITYSTCSIHVEENEGVVSRALQRKAGRDHGWKVLPRHRHPSGLKEWKHRGIEGDHDLDEAQMEACIRCYPNDEYGTMGFFVCAFEREESETMNGTDGRSHMKGSGSANGIITEQDDQAEQNDSEEWEGFSDDM